jgi:hypothetical protein
LDARGTSQTCPECGHWSSDNRVKVPLGDGFDMASFKCVGCGYSADADMNAARIIGMKGAWFFGLPKNPKRGADGKLPDELRFNAFIVNAAQRRAHAIGRLARPVSKEPVAPSLPHHS